MTSINLGAAPASAAPHPPSCWPLASCGAISSTFSQPASRELLSFQFGCRPFLVPENYPSPSHRHSSFCMRAWGGISPFHRRETKAGSACMVDGGTRLGWHCGWSWGKGTDGCLGFLLLFLTLVWSRQGLGCWEMLDVIQRAWPTSSPPAKEEEVVRWPGMQPAPPRLINN